MGSSLGSYASVPAAADTASEGSCVSHDALDDVDADARTDVVRRSGSFLGMWVVMMVAMMLPSFVLMLWRYRQTVFRTKETRLGPLTALVSLGYFFVWTLIGLTLFPLGVALAAFEIELPALARAVPVTVAVVVHPI
jgi:predicted metal-binding membrane protein